MTDNELRGRDLLERIRAVNRRVFEDQRRLIELEQVLDADYRTLGALQRQYEDWRVAQRAAGERAVAG